MYSSSIPILFNKSEYKNDLYIDGAISDRLPVNYLYDFIKESNIVPKILAIDIEYTTGEIKSLKDYIIAILYHPIRNQNVHYSDIEIYTLEINRSMIERLDVGIKERLKLFTDGYNQIKNIYEKNKCKKD
jgi:predicted acylesterase/phospholipase RssA